MKNWIKKVLKEIIEDTEANEPLISKYFSFDYVQEVDGKKLGYRDFVNHMLVQKEILQSATVNIERCISEGSWVSTVHRVDAVKKNGDKLSVKVIAHFEMKEGKIVRCDELTYLLSGAKEDCDIGSRS